jgi:predicted phosphodiesterase
MNLLIFSDTHLDKRFDIEKFNKLKEIISLSDKVIINGDFWEGYKLTFKEFLDSEWKQLFEILKSKHTVYIYGNHDKYLDNGYKVFADICTDQYDISIDQRTYRIEHGDRIVPTFEENLSSFTAKKVFCNIGTEVQRVGYIIFGKSFTKAHKNQNEVMKKWAKKNLPSKVTLVCGHSHYLEKTEDEKFLNTGVINYKCFQYILVKDGKIQIKDLP